MSAAYKIVCPEHGHVGTIHDRKPLCTIQEDGKRCAKPCAMEAAMSSEVEAVLAKALESILDQVVVSTSPSKGSERCTIESDLRDLVGAVRIESKHYREVLRGIAKKIVQTVDDPEEIPEDVVATIEESGACTEAETLAWSEVVCP